MTRMKAIKLVAQELTKVEKKFPPFHTNHEGYGIIKEASERTPGNGRIETGTLYRALKRLSSLGLVESVDRRRWRSRRRPRCFHRPPRKRSVTHRARRAGS